MDSKKDKSSGFSLSRELYYWGQGLVYALIFLLLVNCFFFRFSGVDGSSMEPTLHHGNRVIMQIIGYSTPKKGDIVVVRAPGYMDEPLVKRVIALGGDTIDIDTSTGLVILNGEVQIESYISENIRKFGDQQYPYTVPEGCAFVMGDNRNASRDSRWQTEVGAIPYQDIVGRVLFRIWPLNQIGTIK